MPSFLFFFFNDTATTEIYTLSLHDALPISEAESIVRSRRRRERRARASKRVLNIGPPIPVDEPGVNWTDGRRTAVGPIDTRDRKSTRLNSSHVRISYAVFCLNKKNVD